MAFRPLLTGLCFIPQAVGAFSLAGPASKLVPALGPRRALAAGMSLGLLALVGSALCVAHGPLFGLLVLPIRDGHLGPHRPGRLDPRGDARAGGRPGRGFGQRGADRVAAGRLRTRRGRRVGNPRHYPRERRATAPPWPCSSRPPSLWRPAHDASRAERTGAAALVAAGTPLSAPRRRTSLIL